MLVAKGKAETYIPDELVKEIQREAVEGFVEYCASIGYPQSAAYLHGIGDKAKGFREGVEWAVETTRDLYLEQYLKETNE